jgi:hypothetical protein
MEPVKANKTSTAEHRSAENEPLRAFWAPKPAHQRTGSELGPINAGDRDPLRSPYAPRYPRARLGIEPQEVAAPPQPAHPNGDRHEPPAAPRPGESDRDLERLHASLRWLQRQEAATRLARETPAAPAPAAREVAVRRAASEPVGSRASASLEPERIGPPPLVRRRNRLGWPLRILITSCVIAPVLYYFSEQGRGPTPEPAPPPQLASFKQRFHAPGSIGPDVADPIKSRDDESGTSIAPAHSFRQANVVPTRPPAGETTALPQPSATAAETPLPSKPIRALDQEEIALLVKQGKQFVTAGDLATARIVFQRAAEAGDAIAAVALAATYDPTMLKKLGVVGMAPDIEKARSWYQIAENLGSAEAARRLQVLAKP